MNSPETATKNLIWSAKGESLLDGYNLRPKINVWEMADGSYVLHHHSGTGQTVHRKRYDDETEAISTAEGRAHRNDFEVLRR